VRRLARQLGIDVHDVPGSGPGGRISSDDVMAYAKSVIGGAGREAAAPRRAPSLPDFSKWGEVEVKPMSAIRRAAAHHLVEAWRAPHVTQHDEADITSLEALRGRYAKRVEAGGGRLTVTAILLKLAAAALRRFPQFNASLDMAAEQVVYKKYVHIGVAVDTEHGLLVPVIRHVDRKSIVELAAELAQAAERARNRKLSTDDMQGGCFTITNLGGIGGTAFTPIINDPEVAILGVSRARTSPVYIDGQLQPRLILPLSLSYDHRLIDGAGAARFLRWMAEALEHPLLALLEG
jgi:pyruvate dehydrogenase E2 component (dihydrolipoamide acetyltransferase)